MASFRLTREAIDDLDAIWLHIYPSNPEAADAVKEEIRSACRMLAENPFQGHRRRDLTRRSILFWVLPKYPNYMIVYDPHTRPLAILRVLHGMRDLKQLLKS
jgi:plasmid stabilization system protein ParE